MHKQKLNFGVISTARINDKVLPAILSCPLTDLKLISSRQQKTADDYIKERNLTNVQGCLTQEIFHSNLIDALYIPLNSGIRNEYIINAATQKKHVYAEKPFAGSVQELTNVINACVYNNVQFMDGTMWLHSKRTKQISQKIHKEKLIGEIKRVTASFTFHYPNQEWLEGGDGRTDKVREPMGCFGDQGWYPIGAIMWAYEYELPIKVMMTYTKLNSVDTIIGCGGTLWFKNNRMATFDAGVEVCHRSQFEIVGEYGNIVVDDHVGGFGRTGNFSAYEKPFIGSSKYIYGNGDGQDQVIDVEPCDHVIELVNTFANLALQGIDHSWGQNTLQCHKVMCALFQSSKEGGTMIYI